MKKTTQVALDSMRGDSIGAVLVATSDRLSRPKADHDLTMKETVQFGIGVVKGNPKRCLFCLEPIRKEEAWTKHTSPPDPQFGAYSIIVHDRCQSAKQ